jgi:hypothetical protein
LGKAVNTNRRLAVVILIAAVASLGCSGCALTRAHTYNVWITPDLSQRIAGLASNSAESWNTYAGNAGLTIRIHQEAPPSDLSGTNSIRFVERTVAQIDAEWLVDRGEVVTGALGRTRAFNDGCGECAEIEIATDATDDEVTWAVAHEIGHAMGLQHDPDARALMASTRIPGVTALRPTCSDVNQWAETRNESYSCPAWVGGL